MSSVAVRVNGLSKCYRIGARQKQENTFGEVLASSLKAPVRRAVRLMRGQADSAAELTEEFWALKDVSFEINQGEVTGIIGHNGAGKSTLLKILSRITEPTTGRIELRGRVGSLLEVGTGFHPDLTGRDNIYMNGAILGMQKTEIDRKFDEIVAFAEVDQFIDTPVKHYSSGMYLRLAFAVAAHLEPEILLVDEVLAVGDAAFQRKCLGKMESVAGEGRTVLFVSHNMGAMSSLTQKALCLEHGRLIDQGDTQTVIQHYLDRLNQHVTGDQGFVDLRQVPRSRGRREFGEIDWIRTSNHRDSATSLFLQHEPISIEIGFSIKKPVRNVEFACSVRTLDGGTGLFITPSHPHQGLLPEGKYTISVMLDPNYLGAGNYSIVAYMFVGRQYEDVVKPAIQITVEDYLSDEDNTFYLRYGRGYLFQIEYRWGEIREIVEQQSVPRTKV